MNFTVFKCETGDCGPLVECTTESAQNLSTPVTVASLNITEYLDQYAVSLIGGFNLPISIVTKKINSAKQGGFPMVTNWCDRMICYNLDVGEVCPDEFKKYNANGTIIGCMSVCEKYQTDAACCRGEFKEAQKCLNYVNPFQEVKSHAKSAKATAKPAIVKRLATKFLKKTPSKKVQFYEYNQSIFKKFCPMAQNHIYQDYALSYMHISMPAYLFNCKKTGYDLYFC